MITRCLRAPRLESSRYHGSYNKVCLLKLKKKDFFICFNNRKCWYQYSFREKKFCLKNNEQILLFVSTCFYSATLACSTWSATKKISSNGGIHIFRIPALASSDLITSTVVIVKLLSKLNSTPLPPASELWHPDLYWHKS